MAKSKYEYVKSFEQDTLLLRNTWIVVRIDGRSFHKFTKVHDYVKPNDVNGLQLMNKCANNLMAEFGDIVLAYGESDEYSFVLRRDTKLFRRRSEKIETNFVSLFSSSFVFHWPEFFPDKPLQYPPTFDARCVCYPSLQNIRDYLSWRQADTHINNMYNTLFWTLVEGSKTETEEFLPMTEIAAEEIIRGTVSAEKQELLFQRGINYNNLPAMFRKGSIFIREDPPLADGEPERKKPSRRKVIALKHEDIIREKFWREHPEILAK